MNKAGKQVVKKDLNLDLCLFLNCIIYGKRLLWAQLRLKDDKDDKLES